MTRRKNRCSICRSEAHTRPNCISLARARAEVDVVLRFLEDRYADGQMFRAGGWMLSRLRAARAVIARNGGGS